MMYFFKPEDFTKNYYRKDYNDGFFDARTTCKNVESGGFGFTNGIYIPFDTEIELSRADTGIYNSLQDIFATNVEYASRFEVMTRADHIRLSLDGKTVQKNWDRQLLPIGKAKHCIMFHDWNLNAISEMKEILTYLHKREENHDIFIGNKFPIQCYNTFDIVRWSNVKVMDGNFILQYNGIMEDRALYDFFYYKGQTSIDRQLIYNVTSFCANLNEFIKRYFIQLFKQCIFVRNERRHINLIYDKQIITDERWQRIIDLLNHYVNTVAEFDISDECLQRYNIENWIERLKWHIIHFQNFKFQIEEIQELMEFLKNKYPEAYNCFMNLTNVKLQGEFFIYDKPRNKKTN